MLKIVWLACWFSQGTLNCSSLFGAQCTCTIQKWFDNPAWSQTDPPQLVRMIDQDRAGLTMLEEIAEWVHLVFWSVSISWMFWMFVYFESFCRFRDNIIYTYLVCPQVVCKIHDPFNQQTNHDACACKN